MMIVSGTVRRRLASVLLLAGVLLAGRLAMATHPYEHDLATVSPDCKQCEFCHFFNDSLVHVDTSTPTAHAVDPIPHILPEPAFLPRQSTRFPRAPPSLPV